MRTSRSIIEWNKTPRATMSAAYVRSYFPRPIGRSVGRHERSRRARSIEWSSTLALAQDLTVGSQFQGTTRDAMEEHASAVQERFERESQVLIALARKHPQLQSLVEAIDCLRTLEESAQFATQRMSWIDHLRGDDAPSPSTVSSACRTNVAFGLHGSVCERSHSTRRLAIENFAYGVVFFHGFKSMFKRSRTAARALRNARRRDGTFQYSDLTWEPKTLRDDVARSVRSVTTCFAVS